ncbi:unnamed protein product [Ranitomeya imitator]|uniref:Cadherin domain-containing protein n=1 Tax=Ranitomeya imitator TaxID=111125 RepID=A0ABN9L9N5_9NEOB|nr:unnamed protein product [Ranitomeya imitator]
MPDSRLPKQLLYGELCQGKRAVGGQKKRYKDCLKVSLKNLEVNTNEWEELALERPGVIRVASQIDRETKDQYQVIVQAKDLIGDVGALSATTTVIIKVLDVNDNAPKFQQSTLLATDD